MALNFQTAIDPAKRQSFIKNIGGPTLAPHIGNSHSIINDIGNTYHSVKTFLLKPRFNNPFGNIAPTTAFISPILGFETGAVGETATAGLVAKKSYNVFAKYIAKIASMSPKQKLITAGTNLAIIEGGRYATSGKLGIPSLREAVGITSFYANPYKALIGGGLGIYNDIKTALATAFTKGKDLINPVIPQIPNNYNPQDFADALNSISRGSGVSQTYNITQPQTPSTGLGGIFPQLSITSGGNQSYTPEILLALLGLGGGYLLGRRKRKKKKYKRKKKVK
jgi:hypothetical protein